MVADVRFDTPSTGAPVHFRDTTPFLPCEELLNELRELWALKTAVHRIYSLDVIQALGGNQHKAYEFPTVMAFGYCNGNGEPMVLMQYVLIDDANRTDRGDDTCLTWGVVCFEAGTPPPMVTAIINCGSLAEEWPPPQGSSWDDEFPENPSDTVRHEYDWALAATTVATG